MASAIIRLPLPGKLVHSPQPWMPSPVRIRTNVQMSGYSTLFGVPPFDGSTVYTSMSTIFMRAGSLRSLTGRVLCRKHGGRAGGYQGATSPPTPRLAPVRYTARTSSLQEIVRVNRPAGEEHATMTTTTRPTVSTDLLGVPYASRRSPVVAVNGVVATSQPLAAQAGLSMLQQGGSAVDAALATAIALTVVEPTSNGIGSDVFSLVWDGSTLHGLNGSGRAPAATTAAAIRADGHTTMPSKGWWPVTVPGAPRAWADLHARFGKLPFPKLFEPAIAYARHGYGVSPIISRLWSNAATKIYGDLLGPVFQPWRDTFTFDGRPPAAGERWRSEGHASTLEQIAASGSKSFYEGELARKIAAFAAQTGGPMTL